MRLILGFLLGAFLSGLALTNVACKPAAVPVVVDAAACIAEQAAAGESLAGIAQACGVAVEEAVAALLASKDPHVAGSLAAAEAKRARLAFEQSNLCEGTVIPFDAGPQPEAGGK